MNDFAKAPETPRQVLIKNAKLQESECHLKNQNLFSKW